jgi:hypothetical protein
LILIEVESVKKEKVEADYEPAVETNDNKGTENKF